MNLGPREIIYGLVALLLAYMCWLLIRFLMLGAKAKQKPAVAFDASAAAHAETIQREILGAGSSDHASGGLIPQADPASARFATPAGATQRVSHPPEPDASAFGFDALLEVRQMHHVIETLRAGLEAQGRDIAALHEALAEVRAASQVSPLYSEAVALSHRGYDAQAIAERCGISVAEAELVRSLSKDAGRQEPEDG